MILSLFLCGGAAFVASCDPDEDLCDGRACVVEIALGPGEAGQ